MIEKLEEIKQLGAYSLQIFYGEGEGADDSDIEAMDRTIKMICQPVGYLGSMRALYKGTLKDFLNFDFKTLPKIIANPPMKEEYKDSGFYAWGTECSIEIFNKQNKLLPFSN